MSYRISFGIFFISGLTAAASLSRLAAADEGCSADHRKGVAYLLSSKSRSGINNLKSAIADLPNAPSSAKNKEERGFCTHVSKGYEIYKAHATREILQGNVPADTLKEMKVLEAFENSAFQFARLTLAYCENKDCDGGWLEAKTCNAASIQDRIDRIRADVPKIDALYSRLEQENNRCQKHASGLDGLPPSIASAIEGTQENPNRKVTDRAQNSRTADSGQDNIEAASRSSASAGE